METKKCSKCGIEKSLNDFYKDKRMLLGVTSQCKECHKKGQMNYYYNNYDKVREYQSGYVQDHKEEIKDYMKEYIKDKLEENPEYFKEQYQNYREHQLEYHAERRKDEEYRENMKQYLKVYNQDEKNIERRNQYWRNRYQNDLKYRVKQTMGNRLRATLLTGKNNQRIEDILGYSIEQLMEHLEFQFKEGMSWDNYGEWHIDHIKPIDSFDFISYEDEEFKKCWSLENLQPLWAEDNLKKSNNYS